MTDPYQNDSFQIDPALPEELTDELRQLYDAKIDVKPEMDQAIMNIAAQQLAGRASILARVGPWAGVAAAAAIGLMVWLGQGVLTSPVSESQIMAAGRDVDRSGHVDILDAFTLARMIDEDREDIAPCDLNGDGAVNQIDVDMIAMQCVALSEASG